MFALLGFVLAAFNEKHTRYSQQCAHLNKNKIILPDPYHKSSKYYSWTPKINIYSMKCQFCCAATYPLYGSMEILGYNLVFKIEIQEIICLQNSDWLPNYA